MAAASGRGGSDQAGGAASFTPHMYHSPAPGRNWRAGKQDSRRTYVRTYFLGELLAVAAFAVVSASQSLRRGRDC